MRRTPLIVLAAIATAVLAGCGSSGTSSVTAGSPTTSTPAAAGDTVSPSIVAASAVPAVTGKQGVKPVIAKATLPAPTTLLAHDVIVGTGTTAQAGSQVSVQYTLALYTTGALVQSSYDTGQPFTFVLGGGQVIPGFDAGVSGMKVGGRRELVIPPALGYGDQASQGIPANSTLTFVVDLVSVG